LRCPSAKLAYDPFQNEASERFGEVGYAERSGEQVTANVIVVWFFQAAILQQTAEYIYTLEQEKTRLLSQNCQLKRIINQHEGEASSAMKKRKTDSGPVTIVAAAVSESSDEGIGSMSPEPVGAGGAAPGATAPGATAADPAAEAATEALRREIMDLRVNLDRERRMRLVLEGQVRSLESQIYPESERIRELQPVQLQYHPDVSIPHPNFRRRFYRTQTELKRFIAGGECNVFVRR